MNKKKIIGMVFLFCLIGCIFLRDSKAIDGFPTLFSGYENFNYSNAIITQESDVDSNFRVFFSIKQYSESNEYYLIGNDDLGINSKYTIVQAFFDFENTYDYSTFIQSSDNYILQGEFPKDNGDLYRKVELRLKFESEYITFTFNTYNYVGSSWELQASDIQYLYFSTFELSETDINTFELTTHFRCANHRAYHSDYYINSVFNGYKEYIPSIPPDYLICRVFASYIGGYSSDNGLTALSGIRYMWYNSIENIMYDFIVPKFYDIIDFYLDIEKEVPETYWSYISFKLVSDYTHTITFQQDIFFLDKIETIKFEYEFVYIKGVDYEGKFFYDTEVLPASAMGNWGVFNWVRNGFAFLINALITGIQFLLYLLVAGLNILFGALFILLIIPFLYNVICYWLLYAMIFILFWIYIGILILVNLIVIFVQWLVIDILFPFFTWVIEVLLPIIIDFFILILSWLFALLLYLISLGKADIFELQTIGSSFLTAISDFIVESMYFIITYLPEMLMYVIFYVVLIGFCFLKLTYVKSRGFVNRTNQLQASLDAYMTPLILGKNLIITIKELIGRWV